MKTRCSILFLVLGTLVGKTEPLVEIRADFPGANVKVLENDGSRVVIEPDLRGDRPWFYWLFEAEAKRAGSVTFVLPENVIGQKNGAIGHQGPAVSRDQGETWEWLGTDSVTENEFSVEFSQAGEKIRLGVTIPYTESDLLQFVAKHHQNQHLKVGLLARSPKGRKVMQLQVGKPGAEKKALLMTARHHSAETMASYVVEGFLGEALSETSEAGKGFRDRFVLFGVPFVDADGVEEGDQGKNRLPHDHNRDYTDEPIYPEVRGIQALHKKERFAYAIDVHCPTLVMDSHQVMYFVGAKIHPPKNFEKVTAFAKEIKTRLPEGAPHGPLVWLRDEIKVSPKNSRWFAFQDGVVMSATLEIPFAPKGRKADVESCRAYGRAILAAFVATPFEEIGPAQNLENLRVPKLKENL